MDKLDIKGGEFVKAKVIAREFGYTSDYVGQLCRSGKIDGQLVGRTWYINRQSLIDHKENRYKKEGDTTISTTLEKPNFYNRAQKEVVSTVVETPKYDLDESDLFPQVNKSEVAATKLSVNLADAKDVKVANRSSEYTFSTPDKHETVFKGDLVVKSIPEIDYAEPEPEGSKEVTVNVKNSRNSKENKEISIEAKETAGSRKSRVKIHRLDNPKTTMTNKVKTTPASSKVHPFKTSDITTDVVSVHRAAPADHSHDIDVVGDNDNTPPQSIQISYLLSSAVAAIFVSFLILGLEQQITVTQQLSFTEYVFRVNELIASVYSAK